MTTSPVAIPTVHLNGTSGAVLLEQLKDARCALDGALQALYAAAPNARDYYVQTDGFGPAKRQHEARIAKLLELQDEVWAMLKGVQAQMDARGR